MTDARTLTLTDFLLACIADDGAAARDRLMEVAPLHGGCRGIGCLRRADQPHAFGCPTVMLAVCAAHREIVELHAAKTWNEVSGVVCAACETPIEPITPDRAGVSEMVHWPCPTLRALASAYADRDGWREEWR